MLTFEDFYDIADYGNKNWKGSFTPKEVASNAYSYYCEYLESIKQKKLTHTMIELIKLLKEDLNDETQFWYEYILSCTS